MIDEELNMLLHDIADIVVQDARNANALGRILKVADEHGRSEIAYALDDLISMHPDLPKNKTCNFDSVQKWIGHLIHIEDWRANYDLLMEELTDIEDFEMNILDDLEGAP